MAREAVLFATIVCAAVTARGESRIWTEATAGEPGEVVTVIIYAANEADLLDAGAAVEFDTAALTFITVDFSASAFANLTENLGYIDYSDLGGILVRGNIWLYDGSISFPPTESWELARLHFRVRSGVAAGAYAAGVVASLADNHPELSFTGTETCLVTEYPFSECAPVVILPGTVTVRAATRPSPPDVLQCRQDLEAVRLAWRNPMPYDWVVVLRDGTAIATLAGDAESYTDPTPSAGIRAYAVVGMVGTHATTMVRCTVDIGAPEVAPPGRLTCTAGETGVSLRWDSPRTYTSIAIIRNGAHLALLPGDASAYVDGECPPGVVYYEAIGYVDEWASPPCACVVNGTYLLRLGSVQVAPGSTLAEVPLFLSSPRRWSGFSFGIRLDAAIPTIPVRLTGATADGTALEPYWPFFLLSHMGEDFNPRGGYVAMVAINGVSILELPPSTDTCVLKLQFALSPLAAGTVIPLRFSSEIGVPAVDIIIAGLDDSGVTPECIDGEIVVGDPALPGVKALKVEEAAEDDVVLSWHNAAAYDIVEVERNGALLKAFDGSACSLADTLAGGGAYWYRVRGVAGETVSPWSLVIHTHLPGVAVFRRGDANADGIVNLADAMAQCGYLFRGRSAGCLDAFDANDDGRVSITDVVRLLAYIFVGGVPPPTPGPTLRWFDPTADDLDCAEGTP